jgi:hypothetical protein
VLTADSKHVNVCAVIAVARPIAAGRLAVVGIAQ